MIKLTGWLNKHFGLLFLILISFIAGQVVTAQGVGALTITKAYELARNNYPLIKQRNLIEKSKDYTVENASKGFLPVFSVNGQATYQSPVTNFPFQIPIQGFKLPQFSKDQYRIYGEADQLIYDGGIIRNAKETFAANEVVQQQDLEVQLYTLYDRVNQVFFGALLMDEQLKQNELLQQDIQNGIEKTRALVANGTAYRSSVDELDAQLLQAQQARVELQSEKKAFLDMLGLLVNMNLNDSSKLQKPAAPVLSDNINRPELLAYDYQKKVYDLQANLLNDQLRPKVSFFLQGGYGRPGLNMLSNDFAWYYMGGIRLNWNFGSLYTMKNQEEILDLNKQSLDVEKSTFLFNTRLTQQQQREDVEKYEALLKKDDEIIEKRNSVKIAAGAQLENGVLSAHDYITEVNAEDQARQNKIIHEVQLLQSQYSYQNTMGNISIQP
jgi:outer membrane protein TolC